LHGLLDCLERRGETAETILIRQRAAFAAARADSPVSVSCFCARRKAPDHPEVAAPGTTCCG
jgi:hypothetical protein